MGWYYDNFPVNLAKFDLVLQKFIYLISVKFDWIFVKVIPFDVYSDVNSQPFSV